MIKKLTLIAAAVAALAAFVVPTSASAAEWQFEGKPIAENATMTFAGTVMVVGSSFMFHEQWDVHITLYPGSTGTVDFLTVSNCKGRGSLEGLTCHGTSEALPWTIHCNENGSVTMTSVKLKNIYTETILVTTLTGNIVATGEGGSLDQVSLSGEGTVINGSTPVAVTGTLEAGEGGYSCA